MTQNYIFLTPKLASFLSSFSHPTLYMNLFYCITNNLSSRTFEVMHLITKKKKKCVHTSPTYLHLFINDICRAFTNTCIIKHSIKEILKTWEIQIDITGDSWTLPWIWVLPHWDHWQSSSCRLWTVSESSGMLLYNGHCWVSS